jgi:hypothetical protein
MESNAMKNSKKNLIKAIKLFYKLSPNSKIRTIHAYGRGFYLINNIPIDLRLMGQGK